MRIALLLAATTLEAANCYAQAPLTIDPSFNFQVEPAYPAEWDYTGIIHASERNDGTILVSGPFLNIPEQNNQDGGSFLIDDAGDFVPSNFIWVPYSGVTELANGQYLANHQRHNHDGTWDTNWDYHPDTLNRFTRGGWYVI